MKNILWLLTLIPFLSLAQDFPADWWKEIPRSEAASWEILPQDAGPGEVILSKRTELGLFSNFSAHSFVLEGKKFASVEGLWQSMKYPDPAIQIDPRHAIHEWPYTRAQVEAMTGFEAKEAGNLAKKIYAKYHLKHLSWGDAFFDYLDHAAGSDFHYDIIKNALRAKLDQNIELWDLLLKTKCLKLKPDHLGSTTDTAAYAYYDIYMLLRKERSGIDCP